MEIELLKQKFYDHGRYLKGYTDATLRGFKGYLDYYTRFAHIESVQGITEDSVRGFLIYGRVQKRWSANSFTRCYRNFTVFFRWCVANGYMQASPLPHMEIPRPSQSLPKKLSKQDSMKLLEVVYNYPHAYKFLRFRNHAIFSMFVFSGLRKSELLNLRFTDVDITNLSIFVRQGKGRKDRIVPITFTLAESLTRYLAERKRLGKTSMHFFTSLQGNKAFTESGLRRIVEQTIEASGVQFTVHRLRHTFATLMLEGGCDIYTLSRIMGHSDIKTTAIYLSASAEHLRSQLSKHPLNETVRFS